MSELNNSDDYGYDDDDEEPDSDPNVICRRPPFPEFGAWFEELHRFDAFWATVSALAHESGQCVIPADEDDGPRRFVPLAEAHTLLRRQYDRKRENIVGDTAVTSFDFEAPSGRVLRLCASVGVFHNQFTRVPVRCGNWGDFFPVEVPHRKYDGVYSMEVGAAIAWHVAMLDIYEIVVRLCSSSPAIITGGCIESLACGVPLTNGATYNADAHLARDLALTWLCQYHRSHPWLETTFDAGWSINALREAIEAAPPGECVRILDRNDLLTREQALAVLALPPKELLDALEVCAGRRDPAWKAIEADLARVLEHLEAADPQDLEMVPLPAKRPSWPFDTPEFTRFMEYSRFLQNHSPASVRRLPSGAVVLFAHPYRTLWPLWADALALLGIRPR